MAEGFRGNNRSSKPSRKVGSSRGAARKTGGKTDFGIPAARSNTDYARRESRQTKFNPTTSHPNDPRQDLGATQQARVSGVGKPAAGPGGSSGGDIDSDVIGVGSGAGLAQSAPDPSSVSEAQWSDGSSNEFASGPPARGENQSNSRSGRAPRASSTPRGSTIDRSGSDESTTGRDNPGASGLQQDRPEADQVAAEKRRPRRGRRRT